MGPLLFSAVVLGVLDYIGHIEGLKLQLSYHNNGTIIATWDAISNLLVALMSKGPNQPQ